MRTLVIVFGAAVLAAMIYWSPGRSRPGRSTQPGGYFESSFTDVAASALGEAAKLTAPPARADDAVGSAPAVPAPLGTVLAGRDQQEIATQLTPTAEFVDRQGHVFRGRETIAAALAAEFSQTGNLQTDVQMDSLRLVESGLAIEDGFTTTSQPDDQPPIHNRYTAVEVMRDGKWYLASVRERPWTTTPRPSLVKESGRGVTGPFINDSGISDTKK